MKSSNVDWHVFIGTPLFAVRALGKQCHDLIRGLHSVPGLVGCSWQAVPDLVCVQSTLVASSHRSADSTEGLRGVESLPGHLGLADSPNHHGALKASSNLRPSLTSLGARQTLHFFAVYDG